MDNIRASFTSSTQCKIEVPVAQKANLTVPKRTGRAA